jgi:hypothetical protein
MPLINRWAICGLLAFASPSYANDLGTNIENHLGRTTLMQLAQTSATESGDAPDRRLLTSDFLNEINAFRARVTELWTPPVGAKDRPDLMVTIRIKFKPDATLDGRPIVLTSGDSALFIAARDSAVQALRRGQPFTMLKPEHYRQWKVIEITSIPESWESEEFLSFCRQIQIPAGGATSASGWLLRLSASATKPDAFISSTNPLR